MAVPEGKLRLVDSNSGAVIYSVDLGAPLYSSYQAPGVKDDNMFFHADVDEDGHLYKITDGDKQVCHTMPLWFSSIYFVFVWKFML